MPLEGLGIALASRAGRPAKPKRAAILDTYCKKSKPTDPPLPPSLRWGEKGRHRTTGESLVTPLQ